MGNDWKPWRVWLTAGGFLAGWFMACFIVVFFITMFAVVALRLLGVGV